MVSVCGLCKQGSLRRFRVHCVTLLAWLLGARAHNSWFAVECLQVLRHCVKLWARVYSQIWDSLLARKVWQWIRHVLRMPLASLTRSVLLGLQPSEQQRRTRTGPNTSGHRNVIRFPGPPRYPFDSCTESSPMAYLGRYLAPLQWRLGPRI